MARSTTSMTASNSVTDWIQCDSLRSGTVLFQLTPSGWTGTLTLEGTLDDGTTAITIGGYNLTAPTTVITTTTVAAAQIIGMTGTAMKVRLKCTAFTAGSIAVLWNSAQT